MGEDFIPRFRPVLYAAARAITRDELAGRELTDSLYAELYGLDKGVGSGEPRGRRRSLFNHFHGRSKPSIWLRAVLAQRHVDAVRAARRTEPLPDQEIAEPRPTVRRTGEHLIRTASVTWRFCTHR